MGGYVFMRYGWIFLANGDTPYAVPNGAELTDAPPVELVDAAGINMGNVLLVALPFFVVLLLAVSAVYLLVRIVDDRNKTAIKRLNAKLAEIKEGLEGAKNQIDAHDKDIGKMYVIANDLNGLVLQSSGDNSLALTVDAIQEQLDALVLEQDNLTQSVVSLVENVNTANDFKAGTDGISVEAMDVGTKQDAIEYAALLLNEYAQASQSSGSSKRNEMERNRNAVNFGLTDRKQSYNKGNYTIMAFSLEASDETMLAFPLPEDDGEYLIFPVFFRVRYDEQRRFIEDGMPTFFDVAWQVQRPHVIQPARVRMSAAGVPVEIINKGALT